MHGLRAVVVLAICALTAGCWQSSGSLMGDAKPVQPLRAGKVVSHNAENPTELSHSVLTREGAGYRLTNADKGMSDFGDAFVLRFFALAGLPRDVLVFEAVSDDPCKPGETCRPMTPKSERYYGLVRLTKAGAEVANPDCDKASMAAKRPGVKAGSYGTCTFTNRASLESALADQAKRGWKTNLTYRYE
jgi:hypothetical protein